MGAKGDREMKGAKLRDGGGDWSELETGVPQRRYMIRKEGMRRRQSPHKDESFGVVFLKRGVDGPTFPFRVISLSSFDSEFRRELQTNTTTIKPN